MDVDTDVRRRADRDRAFDPFQEIPPENVADMPAVYGWCLG